jgi:hypothetical protein
MVKKHALINILILSFCLLSFSKCDTIEWLYYNFYTNTCSTKGTKTQNFGVDFENGDMTKLPFYFKIEVTSEDNSPAPLLCFSTTDQNCHARNQLVKNANGKTAVIWLKREEFNKKDDEFYIYVTCEKDSCSYTLTVTGDQYPTFSPNFVYSYLVNSYNKDMRFEIVGNVTNVYMTVAIEGSSKATVSVDDVYREGATFKTGKVLSFFIEYIREGSNMASLTVKGADVDEYITLSVHLVENTEPCEGLAADNYLVPNGPEVTGYLEREVMNEECFPLDLSDSKYNSMSRLFVTGRIHTKYAWFFLEDEHRIFLEESDTEVMDGQLSFVMKNNKKMNYLCLELPSESTFVQYKMAFTISISEPSSLSNVYNYYPPQLNGEIYRRLIPKNTVAFFSGAKSDNSAKKYDYSLYRIKGLTKMYIGDCRKYPDCLYNPSDLNVLVSPKSINQMTIWTTEEDKSSAIGSEKYVIVAYCEDDGNDDSQYCEFETSIISKNKDIYLVEDEKFSKYLVAGEKGKFYIDLQSGRQIQRLTIDIMTFSGDVTFNCHDEYSNENKLTDEQIQTSYDKYFLTNKIFYNLNFAQLSPSKVIVDYEAKINSFFTIQYGVHSYNLNQLEEKVPSGESYLVQIDPTSTTKSKTILLSNFFYKNKNAFLANFFELNCEFNVTRNEKPINFFDGYAQEVLDTSTEGYASDYYQYDIKVIEADLSNYNHKMCMLYVAGYESETKYNREIIVGENINQQIIFTDKFKKIRFLYPHADPYKDLAIHVNVIDKAFYNINIYANDKSIKEGTVTRTQTFYFKGSVITNKCEPNTLCPIVVEAIMDRKIIDTDPMLEITIREVKNTPTYLQKGQAKSDFVCGDKFYYLYTDIGKNEIGEVTVNFLREFGGVWAKVVRKDQTSAEEEANWRGIYRMPSAEWEDSLPYDGYTKKLIVEPEKTMDCIEGCYLLISVQISQIGEYVEDYKFYPFSILTRITPSNRAYTDIPKVVIQADEFVIGSVEVADNERIYEFFEIWLPHDSATVEFDWQSSVAGLYINLGGSRPTTKNAHFKLLPPGKDTVLSLTRDDIVNKANELKIKLPIERNLQDVNLVIGIWTDKTDSIDTELYSLRVHQPQLPVEDPLDITLVETDQKIMCNPKAIGDQYRCLFVVTYDDEDVNMFTPLLAYGGSINNGALNHMYANYIDRDIYDQYDVSQLTNRIPTSQTSELNTDEEGLNYLYTSSLKKGKYIFINVMSDKPDSMMIVTSMPVYNYVTYDLFEFNPNPTTEQLLAAPGEKLRLAFPGTNSIMVDIVTLNGHAEVSWKNDPEKVFILRGVGDRLSLSSGKNIDQLVIRRLVSDNVNDKKLTKMEDPGFAFLISYHLINPADEITFKEITYGKSLEIAFKDTDLPVVLYNKIGTQYRDVNVAITFKDNNIETSGEYPLNPIIISAQLVREKTIYEAKKDKDIAPSTERGVTGNYDTAIKTAQVFLTKEKMEGYNIKESDNPSLYIKIDKLGNFADKVFEKFSVEAQVSGVNDGVVPVEKVYHYGRVRNWANFRLRVDKEKPYMRIQIAFNSQNLDFAVSETENSRTNSTNIFVSTEKARGKIYVTMKVNTQKDLYYLRIFKKVQNDEEFLNGYAFKYINGKDESELYDYKILESPDISYTENIDGTTNEITCTFNKLDIEPGKANVTYFFKVVENSTHVYGEDINTIAVTQSPFYSVFERNPIDNNGKITLKAFGFLTNWAYLNVIAQIQQNNVLEYVAYNGVKMIRPSPSKKNNNDSGKTSTTLFLAVGGILLLIVIALVVIILVFQQRNKNLLNQVKHVSFQQTNSNNNVDPDLLLKKSQQNTE